MSSMRNNGTLYSKYGKRLFDLLLAIPGFVLVTPILAIFALLVKVKLGKPILFKQLRLGLHGTHYINYKFRTMTDERDGEGKLLPNTERLVPLGSLLRKASIDELPELLNVLKGDMSLVGPRPLLIQYSDRYTPEQSRRQEVKPGITGWAQINGRNLTTWEERFAQDVWYVDHCSFFLDCRILIRTVAILFRGDGGVETARQLGEYMGKNKKTNKSGVLSSCKNNGDSSL